MHFDKPEHPVTRWVKGNLTSIFIVSAGAIGALNADRISDHLVKKFTDKHEGVVITDSRHKAMHTPVEIGQHKVGNAFSYINDPYLGTADDADAIAVEKPEKIERRDLPASLSSDDPEGHILWAKFHLQESRNPSHPPSERLRALLSSTGYIRGSGLSEPEYFETIGTSHEELHETIGGLSKDAIDQLKQDLLRAAPNDMIARARILQDMARAYEYVGTTKNGIPFGTNAEEERIRATGLQYENDIMLPLQAIRESAARQGYGSVSLYARTAPRTEAEWERYNDSYLAMADYIETGAPENKLAQFGLTENDWQAIKDRDEALYRMRSEQESMPESTASPFQETRLTPGS